MSIMRRWIALCEAMVFGQPLREAAATIYIKAWFNAQTQQFFTFDPEMHHTQFALDHFETFGLDDTTARAFSRDVEMDDALVQRLIDDGWVRLGCQPGNSHNQHRPFLFAQASTAAAAATALRTLRKRLMDQYPVLAEPCDVLLDTDDDHRELSGKAAEIFLSSGRVSRRAV